MAKDLVRRTSQLERIPRAVVRRVEAAHHRGLEAAAKVSAAAYVAHVGLTLTGQLTAEEGRLVAQYPMAEPRFRAIVDTFAGLVAAEIAEMSF